MRDMQSWIAVMIICTGLLAGCGAEEDVAPPPPPPPGPKEVSLIMLRAMAAGDGPAAAACYDCSVEDREYLTKTMPFLDAAYRLVTAGTEAYGKSAWTAASDKANVGMIVPDIENAEQNMQCEISGKYATSTLKGLPNPLRLHKKGDRWLIIPEERQLPPLGQRGDVLKAMNKVKVAIEKVIPKIGAEGVSADDICNEVRKALNQKTTEQKTGIIFGND